MQETERKYRCCICGRNGFTGYGNNPFPYFVEPKEGDVCCDWCNKRYVIPVRLMLSKAKKEE